MGGPPRPERSFFISLLACHVPCNVVPSLTSMMIFKKWKSLRERASFDVMSHDKAMPTSHFVTAFLLLNVFVTAGTSATSACRERGCPGGLSGVAIASVVHDNGQPEAQLIRWAIAHAMRTPLHQPICNMVDVQLHRLQMDIDAESWCLRQTAFRL